MNKKDSRLRRGRKTRLLIRQLGVYRLSVFRTPRHIYAQVFSHDGATVVAAASTVESDIRGGGSYTGNKTAAEIVGKKIAERALEKGVAKVAFDRSGFKYHGRIKALADAARAAGLEF